MGRGLLLDRRRFVRLAAGGAAGVFCAATSHGVASRPGGRWYEDAFYLMHLDHHTTDKAAVGAGVSTAFFMGALYNTTRRTKD